MDLQGTQKQELVDSYEELRRKWLNPDKAQMRGAVLLIHKGMSIWIRVWLECEQERKEPSGCRCIQNNMGANAGRSLPSGVYADTVHVLAAMVVNTLQEGRL